MAARRRRFRQDRHVDLAVGPVAVHPCRVRSRQTLSIAAALERTSEHPIATALIAAARAGIQTTASALRNTPGAGIEGTVDGVRYRLGTRRFVAEIAGVPVAADPARGGISRVWLGREQGWLACFDLSDRLRPEAEAVVQQLHALGKHVLIWSGDAAGVVGSVALPLGVDGYEAELLPEDKLAHMRRLQVEGAVVAMVGDGVNDAPVLAQAHLSLPWAAARCSPRRTPTWCCCRTPAGCWRVGGRQACAGQVRDLARAAAYNLIALPLAAGLSRRGSQA
jgi:Cu2+-exporting ATPase